MPSYQRCVVLGALLLAAPVALAGQALDSAQVARARALCGPLADDSVVLDPLWPPTGTLVSKRFAGLEGPQWLPSPRVVPEYPRSLLKQRIQGRVIAAAIVDTTGHIAPGSIKVVSTPHEDFVPAVERYLKQQRFTPGRIHGRLMRVCIAWPIDFHLPGH
jgi:hypothetical protein